MSFTDSLLGFGSSVANSSLMKSITELAPFLTFGTNVAGQYLSYSTAKDQYEEASAAIDAALAQNNAALEEQLAQARAQTKESIGQRTRQALIERAKMAAIQNESGAGGNTSERLKNAVMAGSGMDIAMLEGDLEAYDRQIQRAFLQEQAKANNQRSALGSRPSWITPLLGMFGAAANLGFSYRSAPKPSGLTLNI